MDATTQKLGWKADPLGYALTVHGAYSMEQLRQSVASGAHEDFICMVQPTGVPRFQHSFSTYYQDGCLNFDAPFFCLCSVCGERSFVMARDQPSFAPYLC